MLEQAILLHMEIGGSNRTNAVVHSEPVMTPAILPNNIFLEGFGKGLVEGSLSLLRRLRGASPKCVGFAWSFFARRNRRLG